MAIIRITDLTLKTIIGTNDWERKVKQKVVINIDIELDVSKAAKSDKIQDTLDYKALTKKIIKRVEASKYYLLEKLSSEVLKIVMEDRRVKAASVRVDKPLALRFTKSVSIEVKDKRK